MKWFNECFHIHLYLNGGGGLVAVLSDPWDRMDCSPPGSSVHGILQARTLEWVAISFSITPKYVQLNDVNNANT